MLLPLASLYRWVIGERLTQKSIGVLGAIESSWWDKETQNSFEINEKEDETSVEIKIEDTARKGEFITTRNATDGEINIYCNKNSLKNMGRKKLENSQENYGLRYKLKPLYVQPGSRLSKMLKYHDNG